MDTDIYQLQVLWTDTSFKNGIIGFEQNIVTLTTVDERTYSYIIHKPLPLSSGYYSGFMRVIDVYMSKYSTDENAIVDPANQDLKDFISYFVFMNNCCMSVKVGSKNYLYVVSPYNSEDKQHDIELFSRFLDAVNA
jgi:hypothetical protein